MSILAQAVRVRTAFWHCRKSRAHGPGFTDGAIGFLTFTQCGEIRSTSDVIGWRDVGEDRTAEKQSTGKAHGQSGSR